MRWVRLAVGSSLEAFSQRWRTGELEESNIARCFAYAGNPYLYHRNIDESREAFVQHVYISHAERDAQRR